MEEQFVPYELAFKLKELGFDDLCLARFNGGGFYMLPAYDPLRNSEIKDPWFCTAPLWQQAFDFVRNNHRITYIIKDIKTLSGFVYMCEIRCLGKNITCPLFYNKSFNTHEEARLKCLEKLIELVETKKDSV